MTIADISEVLLELGASAAPTDEERAMSILALQRAEGAIRRHLRYNPVQASHEEYYPLKNYSLQLTEGIWESSETQAFIRHLSESVANELQVLHLPIRSVTSLAVDFDGRSGAQAGSFTDVWTEGTDFWPNYDGVDASNAKFCVDGIMRSQGTWPTNPGSVKLVYTSGYSEGEFRGADPSLDASPIWDAALSEAVRRAKRALSSKKSDNLGIIAGVIESERLGDYSYKIGSEVLNTIFGGAGGSGAGVFDILPENMEKLNDYVNWGASLEG
jgi:hypothetical protein